MYWKHNNIGKMLLKEPKMFWYFVPKAGVRTAYAKLTGKKLRLKHYAGGKIHTQQEGNEILKYNLLQQKPFMLGRFGSNEILLAGTGLTVKKGIVKEIDSSKYDMTCFHCGLYPNSQEMMVLYHELTVDACRQLDMYGAFRFIWEDYYIKNFAPQNLIMSHANMLDFWRYEEPYTSALAGKRILVIHPMAKQIESQYNKREKLFSNPTVLPDFELLTIQAIQTVAGEKDARAASWLDGLHYMYSEAMKIDFDIAILGCGAYGMPLASMLKKAGKSVIYMGGVTQMLFGIRGSRWDMDPIACSLYNEHWVSPDVANIPKRAQEVENGCYW